jgi:hypothetical protein
LAVQRLCDDAGVISNREESAFDLRRRHLTVAEARREIAIRTRSRQRCVICIRLDTMTANDWSSASAPTTTALSWPLATTTWTC